jgi:hypothetical protein
MFRRMMTGAACLAASTSILLVGGATGAVASAPSPSAPIGGKPMTTTYSFGGASADAQLNTTNAVASTIPNWDGSFVFNRSTYHFKMVGANPAGGSSRTVVPTEIVPITFTFASGGPPLTASKQVKELVKSPIFNPAPFTSGKTQFADAMQRAEFWNDVSTVSPGYHVLLQRPAVLAPVTINVPAGSGQELFDPITHTYYANIDIGFFESVLPSVVLPLHPPSTTLPLIISSNVFLYSGADCCVYGFHGAFKAPGSPSIFTFAYANFLTKNLTSAPLATGTWTISHEVAEWANDPFVHNRVPPWIQPGGSSTCFSNVLEVGDPLEALNPPGYTITANDEVWDLTDVAGISWFAHTVPSTEKNGLYSYHGFLTSPSTFCKGFPTR